jgi:hypothetical protein
MRRTAYDQRAVNGLFGRFVTGLSNDEAFRPLDGGAGLFRPEMLMIGATGRNAGKTELACRVIRALAARVPIAALKVTTVVGANGNCPHGGEGCGTCSSLGEPWCVTRELDAGSGKDTSRLLRAGAREAWWLRVREEALADAAADLLSRVPAGWASVCESNRLRRVVEPGLFLQVRSEGERSAKPSARSVADLADRVVVSDGSSFDLDLERICVLDGQWALRRDACAVVVAAEEQNPSPKAMLEPLLASLRAQFTQVEIAAAPAGRADGLLGALAAALPRSSHDWCLVHSSCRGPLAAGYVNALFRRREDVEAVVMRDDSAGSRLPTGLYHKDLLSRVHAGLDADPPRTPGLGSLGRVRELALAEAER